MKSGTLTLRTEDRRGRVTTGVGGAASACGFAWAVRAARMARFARPRVVLGTALKEEASAWDAPAMDDQLGLPKTPPLRTPWRRCAGAERAITRFRVGGGRRGRES